MGNKATFRLFRYPSRRHNNCKKERYHARPYFNKCPWEPGCFGQRSGQKSCGGGRIMKIALMGQPNSGKSTIFNSVAGYKAVTSNFPGKTVGYTLTKFNLFNQAIELVDLPGTYSLTSFDLAELEARKYLLNGDVNVVINVIDALLLSRSLELTLQLLELKLPICLLYTSDAADEEDS